jgi:hypothetical protein
VIYERDVADSGGRWSRRSRGKVAKDEGELCCSPVGDTPESEARTGLLFDLKLVNHGERVEEEEEKTHPSALSSCDAAKRYASSAPSDPCGRVTEVERECRRS